MSKHYTSIPPLQQVRVIWLSGLQTMHLSSSFSVNRENVVSTFLNEVVDCRYGLEPVETISEDT